METEIKSIPAEVLEKAKKVGNIFDEMDKLKRALLTIEKMTLEDYISDTKITDIYKIAHAFGRHCENPHKNWIELQEKLEEQLKDL